MQVGRPTAYSPEMRDMAAHYIENFKAHGDQIPSHVGLCKVLGVAKSTLYNWAKDEGTNFLDILELCNERQEQELFNNGLNGTFNSAITKLALGKHGYHDKQDTELSGKEGNPIQIVERHIVRRTENSED